MFNHYFYSMDRRLFTSFKKSSASKLFCGYVGSTLLKPYLKYYL